MLPNGSLCIDPWNIDLEWIIDNFSSKFQMKKIKKNTILKMGNSPAIPRVNDVIYDYPKMTFEGTSLNLIENVELLFPDQLVEVTEFTVLPLVKNSSLVTDVSKETKYLLALNIPKNINGTFQVQYTYLDNKTNTTKTVTLPNEFIA